MRVAAPGVRMSLVALVLGCVVPIACMAGLLIFNFYSHEQAQLTRHAISRARALISVVDRDFASTGAALQALGTSHRLASGDLGGFHARALEVLRDMHADSITVVGLDGQLLLSTRLPFGAPLPKLASAPLLRRVLQTGRPGNSDLYLGPEVGTPIYTVAVPVLRDGSMALLLTANAAPARMSSMLSDQHLPDGWRGAITDRAYRIVARSHEMEKYAGRAVNPGLIEAMRAAPEGSVESTTLDGIPVISVFSRSAVSGWAVVLGMPLAELRAGLRQTLVRLIAATLCALLAALVLAWFIGGRIAGSVTALIAPALAVGGGGPLPPLPALHFREAKELGGALRDAAGSVRDARAGRRESDQRLALAAQAARLGIWSRDLVHDEIWASERWRALFGFPASGPVLLEDLLRRVHPDDRAAVERVLASRAPEYDIEYRIEGGGSAPRWIASHGGIEFDADGRALVARGVAFDITAHKQAELDLGQKRKEIMHLSRVTMLGELSGALAHELNQPLTAILSNAQAAQRFLARDPPDLDEVREILQDIVDEDKRAGEVIRRLRGLLRSGETQRQTVDLGLLVTEVGKLLRSDMQRQGIVWRTDCAPDLATVDADPVQLQQVLINLMLNACDAMAATPMPERALLVRVAPDGEGWIRVSVIDRGVGIPADACERIFDAFYTTKSHGIGLGLSICRTIIEANGGRLWAEPHPQCGASLHFRLPLPATVAVTVAA
jgi:C4-dicarboxylate-specific signal transduction histidine kinase